MTRYINNVIRAAHDKNVAVFIDETGVGRFVIPGKFLHISGQKTLIVVPEGRQRSRG